MLAQKVINCTSALKGCILRVFYSPAQGNIRGITGSSRVSQAFLEKKGVVGIVGLPFNKGQVTARNIELVFFEQKFDSFKRKN